MNRTDLESLTTLAYETAHLSEADLHRLKTLTPDEWNVLHALRRLIGDSPSGRLEARRNAPTAAPVPNPSQAPKTALRAITASEGAVSGPVANGHPRGTVSERAIEALRSNPTGLSARDLAGKLGITLNHSRTLLSRLRQRVKLQSAESVGGTRKYYIGEGVTRAK